MAKTEAKKTHAALTAEQRTTLENLTTGQTAAEAATATGVELETVRGWLEVDPAFRAELNARQQDAYRANVERVRALVPNAIAVLEAELTGPRRLQAAMVVLKAASLANVSAPAGGTTPEAVEQADREAGWAAGFPGLGRDPSW